MSTQGDVPSVQQAFDRAVALHGSGRLAEAQAAYEDVRRRDPGHFDAVHLLGLLAIQTGRPAEGVALIEQATAIKPHVAAAHSNLAAGFNLLGRFEDGLRSADAALARQHDSPDAHNNRGNSLRALGRPAEALASYDAAVALRPDFAEAYDNRGNALQTLGRHAEALADHQRALALRPYPEACNNRGNCLAAMGRHREAVDSYDSAIALRPGYAEAFNNRGTALAALGRSDEALASFDRALALRPGYTEARNNRGNALQARGRYAEALASYDELAAQHPDSADAHSNRGNALLGLGRREEALASFDRAIALRPDHAEAHSNRSNALYDMRRLEEALASCERAIELRPDYAKAFSNRGNALQELARPDEALASYERAIALEPDLAMAHYNRGLVLLAAGRYDEGWPEYEWRHRPGMQVPARSYASPQWRGESDIAGKTLFIHSEQGLGDTLQFCRFLRTVEARGARVLFAPQDPLRSLLGTLSPTIELVRFDDKLRPFDYHCYLASLPLALRTTLQTIPAEVPYLRAEPERVDRWRRLIGAHGFRIGISWQGSTLRIDVGRSFALAELAAISRLPGVRLISLQKGAGTEQLARLPDGMAVETLGEGYDSGPDAFLDAAAVMESLDLVITSDTAIAHLAGALGRPAWVALKQVPDWRWLRDRPDSPWYPTLRLFRQTVRDDWRAVFQAMEQELRATLPATGQKSPRVPVSWGELIDKITILEIKRGKLADGPALANVRRELSLLSAAAAGAGGSELDELRAKLKAVNEELWGIEDEIRAKEAADEFDERFIELARSVYERNDRRAAIKRQINALLASELVEEKLYRPYRGHT